MESQITKEMGKKIKELRKEAQLNQTEFGKLFHLSQNDVTNIENGKKTVSYELLLDIARHFNVTTDYLIKTNGVREKNIELQKICDYTGLSEQSIEVIRQLCIPENNKAYILDEEYINELSRIQTMALNEFINSDVFRFLIGESYCLFGINEDALAYLSLYFMDFEQYSKIKKDKNELIVNIKYFLNEYNNDALHNALQDKQDLILFNIQRSIISYFEHFSKIIYEINSKNLDNTFDWIRWVVYDATAEASEKGMDAYKNKIDEYGIPDDFKDDVSKLKELYERMKDNE